jgi:hypothetical protein
LIDVFTPLNMFDSFFKRSTRSSRPEQTSNNTEEPDHRAAARQAALARAEALADDEPAAADFVLQCEFADARLKAAHHIHSKPVLERVAQAMRNADRRVAKLMQQRLDAMLEREADAQKAGECVKEAQRLAEEPQLMPNQVADLDRAWQAVGDIAQALRSSFDDVRSILRTRLETQTALQRAVIDAHARLQHLAQSVADTPHLLSPAQIAQTIDGLEQEMAQHCTAREATSLPKNLLSEFGRQLRSLKQISASVENRHALIAAREAILAGWEAARLAELKEDVLKRAWHALPALQDEEMAPFDARFDALLDRIDQSRQSKQAVVREARQDKQLHFTEALDRMEKALDDGTLQVAAEQDKTLRSIDLKSLRLSDAQTSQLAKARSELSRLQDWAKWGGNVSRAELLKAAEELPARQHGVLELAKKVGSLRERWKSLDNSAGPADKELWQRFDAACTTAYAPAAAHFKKMADERRDNLAKAQAIVAEIRQFAGSTNCADEDPGAVDWKAIAGYCARTTQVWQRLGPIDRKEKKSADAEFAAAMRDLTTPLAVQQQIEITRRDKMIAEASSLNPSDRGALDQLQRLQERWQERAKSMPLERSDEQALWQRFRSACDAVFAKRKEIARSADVERQQQLQAKQALCATLEAAANGPHEAILKILREVNDAWNKTAPVPRASERQIQARYQAAITALQKRLDEAQRSASAAQVSALRGKLALCQAIEGKIARSQAMDDGELAQAQADWQAFPALSSEYENVLDTRFNAAIAALKSGDRQYATLLEQNRAALAQQVLRLEILLGIDSPPELSRERLQLQVEVLQSSLKAAQKPVTQETRLLQLCGLPALADQQIDRRINQVLARSKST